MKVGAVLLVLMGIMTLTGFMNGIPVTCPARRATERPKRLGSRQAELRTPHQRGACPPDPEGEPGGQRAGPVIPRAGTLTLMDQYGEEHTPLRL